MRILTRPDFDGVVCAVLLEDALDIREPIEWVDPNDMQHGIVDVRKGDIIANLPFHENCSLWFDHHYTNRINRPFEGCFEIAPSAAGIIYEYYKDKFKRNYSEIAMQADKIDSADLTPEEVLHPENYPCLLISMTLFPGYKPDMPYWNQLVRLFGRHGVNEVMGRPDVKLRCDAAVERNAVYREMLKKYTRVKEHVSVTDFRNLDQAPSGNRFLVYSLFPETIVNVRIRDDGNEKEKISLSIGHSIFNRNCRVNAGKLLSRFEGGGHPGAASCRFHRSKSEAYINAIIDVLLKNEPE